MPKRTNLFLWLLLPLLAGGAVLGFLFWDTLLLYLAPKTVLTGSAVRLLGELEERFSKSPAALLLEYYEPQGRYTVQLEASTENPLMGTIAFDLTVQTDGTAHSLLAQGSAGTTGNDLDVSLYLSDSVLAVSSKDLVQGTWYGLTYDSFRQDIRSIPLLQYVITDSLISRWEQSLRNIQSAMQSSWTGPDISALETEDARQYLTALLLLPGKVSRDQVKLECLWVDCFRIDYTVDAQQLNRQDATASVSFYLYENRIVQLEFYYSEGADRVNGTVFLGVDPTTEPLSLSWKQTRNGVYSEKTISQWTDSREGRNAEAWTVQTNGTATTLDYTWNRETGDMVLSVNGGTAAALNLTQTPEGLRLHTGEPETLLPELDSIDSCTLTIQKGAEFTPPEYKKLDAWSLEDFWTLLGGIGSLFGLKAE